MSSSDESDDDQTGRNPAVQSSDDSASDSEHDEKPQDSASRLDLTVEKFLEQRNYRVIYISWPNISLAKVKVPHFIIS